MHCIHTTTTIETYVSLYIYIYAYIHVLSYDVLNLNKLKRDMQPKGYMSVADKTTCSDNWYNNISLKYIHHSPYLNQMTK